MIESFCIKCNPFFSYPKSDSVDLWHFSLLMKRSWWDALIGSWVWKLSSKKKNSVMRATAGNFQSYVKMCGSKSGKVIESICNLIMREKVQHKKWIDGDAKYLRHFHCVNFVQSLTLNVAHVKLFPISRFIYTAHWCSMLNEYEATAIDTKCLRNVKMNAIGSFNVLINMFLFELLSSSSPSSLLSIDFHFSGSYLHECYYPLFIDPFIIFIVVLLKIIFVGFNYITFNTKFNLISK